MAYADYSYYVTYFFGTQIGGGDFSRLSKKASDYIDYYTMDKARYYTDTNKKLADCCCALAEKMQELENENSGVVGSVASETVGSHSVSYRTKAEIEANERNAYASVINHYLYNTGLLYRGIPLLCTRRTL